VHEANEHVLRFFEKLYFGHRCSAACGPVNAIGAHKSDDLWSMTRE
jgi:hypothetical protein